MSNENSLTTITNPMAQLKKQCWVVQKKEQRKNRNVYNPQIKAQHNTNKPKFEVPGYDTMSPLKCVIVKDTAYNEFRRPGDDSPAPECYSIGGEYGTAYGSCADCRFGKWVENADGRKGKACKTMHKVAVVLEEDDKAQVYELKINAASLKAFNEYVKLIDGDENGALGSVITEMTLKANKMGNKLYSTIEFRNAGAIDESFGENFLNRLVLGYKAVEGNNFFKFTPMPEKVAAIDSNTVTPEVQTESEEDEIEDVQVVDVDAGDEVIPF